MEERTMGDDNGAGLMLAMAVLLKSAGYSEEEIKDGYMRAKTDSVASTKRTFWHRKTWML